jgi:carbohydrate kinase (thermoresistant glucokinase family)
MTRYVVMGVSGCGKSSIGALLAQALGARFIDGDDLHPAENIAKMSQGIPLDDTDRAPWLARVGETLAAPDTIIACSALKRSYRDIIRANAGHEVTFLYLHGTRDVLIERMQARPGHFMPASLLDSQLATLQPPTQGERYAVQNITATPDQIRDGFLRAIKELEI